MHALIDRFYRILRLVRIGQRVVGVIAILLVVGSLSILSQWLIVQQQLSYMNHLQTEQLPADQLIQEAALEIASSQVVLIQYVAGQETDLEIVVTYISDAKRLLTEARELATDEDRLRQIDTLFGQVDDYAGSVDQLQYAKLTADTERINLLSAESQRLGNALRAGASDTVRESVEQAQADLQRAVRNFEQNSIFGALIVLLAFVIVGVALYLMARSVIRPVQQIQDAAQHIAGGEWGHRLPDTALLADELGQLAVAFNQMAEQLQASYSELEQRVSERTADLERRAIQVQAAAEVARDATTILDPQELMVEVVTLISQRFGFYHAGLFLLDETGEWAVLQAAASEGGRRMLARSHRLKVGETGIVGYVTDIGEPRIALDVGADAVYFDNPDLPGTRSEIALPLRARGEIIGALDVQSTEAAAFSDEDVAVLQTLADQVGIAISNARLYQQAQESLETARRAYGEYGREAWLEMTRRGGITGYQYEPGSLQMNPQAWTPAMAETLRAGKAMRSVAEPRSLAIPIQIRNQTIGVIDVTKPEGAAPWTAEEIALFDTLADQLGVALDGAQLYQETQRRAAQERLTGEITSRMRETLDVDTVLQTAVREIGEALGITEAEVRLYSDETPRQ
ncbi:MAG: GAF domain-containing protein [Chloroflexi bacterium]|nr:GAF domain-containing protein [Chloroflexota bacterium]MBU1751398.1 GAF domain-containing protein [Chloroflexota bacterium]MBU1879294.1 GAF domain-containing protein [Chloroflexota bacterium]